MGDSRNQIDTIRDRYPPFAQGAMTRSFLGQGDGVAGMARSYRYITVMEERAMPAKSVAKIIGMHIVESSHRTQDLQPAIG